MFSLTFSYSEFALNGFFQVIFGIFLLLWGFRLGGYSIKKDRLRKYRPDMSIISEHSSSNLSMSS